MTTTHPVDTPTYVRIRDLDPERRATHAADAIVCRADRLADALLESGWFAVLPDLIAPELQRALLSGACTDGMERTLDIEIEKLSGGDATLPSMTNTTHLFDTTGTVPALPAGTTYAYDFDPEDDKRLIRADLGGAVLYAAQTRDGRLDEIAIMVDGGEIDDSYSSARLRELIPALLRAAELADQWAGMGS